MNAKTQEVFTVIVGSNDDSVTNDMILKKMMEVEVEFNKQNSNMRMHSFKFDIEKEIKEAIDTQIKKNIEETKEEGGRGA